MNRLIQLTNQLSDLNTTLSREVKPLIYRPPLRTQPVGKEGLPTGCGMMLVERDGTLTILKDLMEDQTATELIFETRLANDGHVKLSETNAFAPNIAKTSTVTDSALEILNSLENPYIHAIDGQLKVGLKLATQGFKSIDIKGEV